MLDITSGGNKPLYALSRCYDKLSETSEDIEQIAQFRQMAEDYKYQADTYITDFDKLDGWRVTARSEEHTYFDICYEFVCYQKEK